MINHTTHKLDLDDLYPVSLLLTTQGEYALVGWYIRVEQEHALVAQRIRERTTDDELPTEAEAQRERILREWLCEAEQHLPDWVLPRYVDYITDELKRLFTIATDKANEAIRDRKLDHTPEGQHYNTGAQRAYERMRSSIFYVWNLVAHRQPLDRG